jgi:hypothetical protein
MPILRKSKPAPVHEEPVEVKIEIKPEENITEDKPQTPKAPKPKRKVSQAQLDALARGRERRAALKAEKAEKAEKSDSA